MRIFRYIPVLIVPVIIYAFLVLSWGAQASLNFAGQAFTVPLASGDLWKVSTGALFIAFSIVCLFAEVVRSARPTNAAIGENMATAIVMIICLVLFLLVRGFGTSEFFLVILLLTVDFMTDSAVMVFTARRSIGVGPGN
jgi:hypothetical protein